MPRLLQLPDSRLVHTTDLYTEQELKTAPAYNKALPQGVASGPLPERLECTRALLWRGARVSDRDRVLYAREPADRARLERLVAGALPTSGPAAVSGPMMLRRSPLLRPFVVHVKPVGVRWQDCGVWGGAALVLIVEPGYQSGIDLGLVAATLGLTPTESQIAVWVAECLTVDDLAGATGRQESTIRWHLKQIYRKPGISRQADLMRLVLSISEFT